MGLKYFSYCFLFFFWYHGSMTEQNTPITLHSRVTVELVDTAGEVERREFTIVTARQADFKSGLLDENTPLARSLLGKSAGEIAPYAVGDLKEIRILSVESGEANHNHTAAEKRRAAVRKATVQSEITNQMIFASAIGSKWGDYEVDVDKIMKEKEEKEDEQAEEK